MSSFAYISFPREVDKSCCSERKIDDPEAFRIENIRGTEMEKQCIRYFGNGFSCLTEELTMYLVDWFNEFHGIEIFDIQEDLMFDGVFTNQFIYNFTGDFRLRDEKSVLEECNAIE